MVDGEAVGGVYVVSKAYRLIQMKKSMVISNVADCFIELIHRDSSPTTWIVRRSRKNLWFKKRISSHWFIDGGQALLFAREMKQKHDRHALSNDLQKNPHYAQ